jgi:hypothetical protein
MGVAISFVSETPISAMKTKSSSREEPGLPAKGILETLGANNVKQVRETNLVNQMKPKKPPPPQPIKQYPAIAIKISFFDSVPVSMNGKACLKALPSPTDSGPHSKGPAFRSSQTNLSFALAP